MLRGWEGERTHNIEYENENDFDKCRSFVHFCSFMVCVACEAITINVDNVEEAGSSHILKYMKNSLRLASVVVAAEKKYHHEKSFNFIVSCAALTQDRE